MATSATQSPPVAKVSARSSTILAGSWTVAAVRHGAIAAVSSAPRPETCTVFVSNTPPEVVSTDSVRVGSTINSGYTLFFTCEVPFFL